MNVIFTLDIVFTKVLYISEGYCTEFNIYYLILYQLLVINDSIFKLIMLFESGIQLKNVL